MVFNRVLAVVKVHVHAECHQAFRNYHVDREKRTQLKTILSSLTRTVIISYLHILTDDAQRLRNEYVLTTRSTVGQHAQKHCDWLQFSSVR